MNSDKLSNLRVITEVIIPLLQIVAALGLINLSLICIFEILSPL